MIQVPNDYVSESPINATATFDGETIATLGLRPGQYTWSWGSGGNADSITMNVPTGNPGPVVDPNAAEKRALEAKIKRLKKAIKRARKAKNRRRVARLQKKQRKFVRRLRFLRSL